VAANEGNFLNIYEVIPTNTLVEERFRYTLNDIVTYCHEANQKWWQDPKTQEPISRNRAELLMLIVSEIAEAMEGERKDLMDDKLPHRKMAEVELADALIRIFDYAGGFGYDLGSALIEKMKYNATRRDHTHEARLEAGGKKF
jgi:NTP pyrophosphatase (non-canonical NTP hydrolase)